MLKISFIRDGLLIEDHDDHLICLNAYSGNYKTIGIHVITDADLRSLIDALVAEEHKRREENNE